MCCGTACVDSLHWPVTLAESVFRKRTQRLRESAYWLLHWLSSFLSHDDACFYFCCSVMLAAYTSLVLCSFILIWNPRNPLISLQKTVRVEFPHKTLTFEKQLSDSEPSLCQKPMMHLFFPRVKSKETLCESAYFTWKAFQWFHPCDLKHLISSLSFSIWRTSFLPPLVAAISTLRLTASQAGWKCSPIRHRHVVW